MPQERLKRGVGLIYIAAGLLQWLVLAAAYLGAPAALLSRLFFGQFLFLILGGLGYLAGSFARSGVFRYEALAHYLVGVAVYVVLLSLAALLLAKGLAGPWLGVAPGAFLLVYGARLLR